MEDLGYRHYQRFLDGDPLGFEEIVKVKMVKLLIAAVISIIGTYSSVSELRNSYKKNYIGNAKDH